MTEKAEKILIRMRENDRRKRILERMRDPRSRSGTMDLVNRMDQDEPSRVGGGDQEMKVLDEMNELQDFEKDIWSNGSV